MNDLTVVYYTDIHCIIDIKKEIEMTNYETLQQICERAKENIDMLNASGKLDALSKCIALALMGMSYEQHPQLRGGSCND